jgi:hypothetical protein
MEGEYNQVSTFQNNIFTIFLGGVTMKIPYLPLRIVLGSVVLSHTVIGLAGAIPIIPIDIATRFYGASLTVTPQIEHITQMFGAYMITVGLLAAFAVRDPVKNKFVIYGVSFLLFVRVIQRLFFADQAFEVFEISPALYWAQTALFLAIAVSLILLRPKESKPSTT